MAPKDGVFFALSRVPRVQHLLRRLIRRTKDKSDTWMTYGRRRAQGLRRGDVVRRCLTTARVFGGCALIAFRWEKRGSTAASSLLKPSQRPSKPLNNPSRRHHQSSGLPCTRIPILISRESAFAICIHLSVISRSTLSLTSSGLLLSLFHKRSPT